jgi:hypothetical protein
VCGAASRQLQFAACPLIVQQGEARRNPKMQSFPYFFFKIEMLLLTDRQSWLTEASSKVTTATRA